MAGTGGRAAQHILLYGPPAAGKLTIGRELAARCGLRLFDNHASIDPALRLFEFGIKEHGALIERLRVELLGTAARAGLDVVSTLVFAHPDDRSYVARLVGASEAAGASVTFVQLLPSRKVLEERVGPPPATGPRRSATSTSSAACWTDTTWRPRSTPATCRSTTACWPPATWPTRSPERWGLRQE